MEEAQEKLANPPGPEPTVSVLHQVYGAFADALGAEEGRKSAAERLRKVLIIDGARSEAALRAALFEGDAS